MGFTFWLFILLSWFVYCVYKPTITQVFFQIVDKLIEKYSQPSSFIHSLYTAHRPDETTSEAKEESIDKAKEGRKESKERKRKSKDKERTKTVKGDTLPLAVYTRKNPLSEPVYTKVNPLPIPSYTNGHVIIPPVVSP